MAYILVVLLVAEARSALIQFSGSSLVAHLQVSPECTIVNLFLV